MRIVCQPFFRRYACFLSIISYLFDNDGKTSHLTTAKKKPLPTLTYLLVLNNIKQAYLQGSNNAKLTCMKMVKLKILNCVKGMREDHMDRRYLLCYTLKHTLILCSIFVVAVRQFYSILLLFFCSLLLIKELVLHLTFLYSLTNWPVMLEVHQYAHFIYTY